MIKVNKKSIFIILIVCFLPKAYTAITALELVERDVLPSVLKLKNDTTFYSYLNANRNILLLEENRKIFSNTYILSRGSQFWNLYNHRTEMSNAGPGLYLAIDPFISSPTAWKYSGANFGETMLELTFAKDTKYLSLKKPITLKDDTLQALRFDNILDPMQLRSLIHHNQISQDTLRYMVEPEFVHFRLLMQHILLNNNISLIEYEWVSSLEFLCDGKQLTSAMVFIGEDFHLANLINTNLIYWPGNLKNMGLNNEETLSYNRNLKLINLLSKLKPLEETSRASKAKSYIQNAYKDEQELREIREKLFECI
jgi:hypothetical protein